MKIPLTDSCPARRILCLAALAVIALILPVQPDARAEYWYSQSPFDEVEMFMQDFMVPDPVNTTYYAIQSGWLSSKVSDRSAYFYSGYTYAQHGATPEQLNPNHPVTGASLWSFWPIQPGNLPIKTLWWRHGMRGPDTGIGEGAAGSISGFVMKLEKNVWQRNLMRLWKPRDPELAKEFSYMGWWAKVLENDEPWMLMGVMRIPIPEAHFPSGVPGGFIEKYGPFTGIRNQGYRNIYSYNNGKWAPNKFSFSAKAKEQHRLDLHPEGNYVVANINSEPFQGSRIRTPEDAKLIDLGGPTQPSIDPCRPKAATATLAGKNLFVEWKFHKNSSPQLRYTLELLSESEEVIREIECDFPFQTSHFVHLEPKEIGQVGGVRIQLEDIFDQTAKLEAAVSPRSQTLLNEKKLTTNPLLGPTDFEGYKISYYMKNDGALDRAPRDRVYCNWEYMPDEKERENLDHHSTYYQRDLNFFETPRTFGVAGTAESNLQILQPGMYRFHLAVADGGKLYLGDKLVVDRDDAVSSTTHESNWVFMKPGSYPMKIDFYLDGIRAGSGQLAQTISLQMEGPDIPLGPIAEKMVKIPRQDVPGFQDDKEIEFTSAPANQSSLRTFDIKFKREIPGLQNVAVVSRNADTWLYVPEDKLDDHLKETILIPEADRPLDLRLGLKDNIYVTVATIQVKSENPPTRWWLMVEPQIPISTRPFGYVESEDRVALIGDGNRWAARKVKGDFIYTMRVKELRNWVEKSRGKIPWSHASVGFYCSPTLKHEGHTLFRWFFDHYFLGAYNTPEAPGVALRTKALIDSGHKITDPCFFRFTRSGNTFTAEVKGEDDEDYRTLFTQTVNLPEELWIGPHLLQSTHFHQKRFFGAVFDNIKIEGEALPLDPELQAQQTLKF